MLYGFHEQEHMNKKESQFFFLVWFIETSSKREREIQIAWQVVIFVYIFFSK